MRGYFNLQVTVQFSAIQVHERIVKHCVFSNIYIYLNGLTIRPGKKNFGSGQLIFENWSGGPVDIFFEPQPKFSKSNESQHAEMMPIPSGNLEV